MATTLADPGKLMPARKAGDCEQCGKPISLGERIYYSSVHGPRHKRCVEADGRHPDRAPASADASRATSAPARDDDWRFDDGTSAPTPPRDDARATTGGGGGLAAVVDRDVARREIAFALDTLIDAGRKQVEALERLRSVFNRA